jgi:hypothetical protein
VFGNRYTIASTGYISGYRVYTVTGNRYILMAISDPLNNPITTELATFTAGNTGWLSFTMAPMFVVPDQIFDLVGIVAEPDPTPTTSSLNYTYIKPQNDATPNAGECVQSAKSVDVLRFHYTDADAGDNQAFLNTIEAGDIIERGLVRWAVQSVNPDISHIEFGVSPAQQSGGTGVQVFSFETVEPTPITYGADVGYWTGTTQGLFGADISYGDIVPDSNAYGTDILVQPALVSDDWDFLARTDIGGTASSGRIMAIDTLMTDAIATLPQNENQPVTAGEVRTVMSVLVFVLRALNGRW